MPFGSSVPLVVWVAVADRGQGVVDAEAADGCCGLGGDGKRGSEPLGCLLSGSNNESFVGSEMHLESVRDIVLDELCGGHQFVGAVVRVGGRGSDAEVVDVQAYDKTGVSLGEPVHDKFEHGP
jgi:hypothetical protein